MISVNDIHDILSISFNTTHKHYTTTDGIRGRAKVQRYLWRRTLNESALNLLSRPPLGGHKNLKTQENVILNLGGVHASMLVPSLLTVKNALSWNVATLYSLDSLGTVHLLRIRPF